MVNDHHGLIGFFDLPEQEPDDDLDAEGVQDEMQPAAWIGGVLAADLVVARSDEAAVVISRISAFPEGSSSR